MSQRHQALDAAEKLSQEVEKNIDSVLDCIKMHSEICWKNDAPTEFVPDSEYIDRIQVKLTEIQFYLSDIKTARSVTDYRRKAVGKWNN